MAYSSSHGDVTTKGDMLGTSIAGSGVLPCGTFNVTVLLNEEGYITLEDRAHGTHTEKVDKLPEWAVAGDEFTATIALSEGVYARIENNKIALFDSKSEKNLTGWLKSLGNIQIQQKKYKAATPILTELRKRGKGAALVWRRNA